MPNPEIVRDPKPPSRSIRTSEVRRLNYEEAGKLGHAFVAWDDEDADLELEAGAEWGAKQLCAGYERLHLHMDFDFGAVANDITTVFVAAQASPSGGLADPHWFDVYTDEAGDGVLVRKVWAITVNTGLNAKTQVAWQEQLRVSRYMRFKVWVNGTAFVDSRATLKAQRVMDSQ